MVEGTDKELGVEAERVEGDAEIEKIKEDIGDVRANMGETIDAIQERLSIPVITEQIKAEVSEQVSAAVETTKTVLYEATITRMKNIMKNISGMSVGGSVLPFLLIGTGTGLLVMNRNKIPGRKSTSPSSGSKNPGNGGRRSTEQSSSGSGSFAGVSEAASAAYQKVGETVSNTASKVADAAAAGKDSYANYFDGNPLAVGAVAAALGLAVGLALPLTETENELLGETAGSIRDRLEEVAKETVTSVKDSASELIDNLEQAGNAASVAQTS